MTLHTPVVINVTTVYIHYCRKWHYSLKWLLLHLFVPSLYACDYHYNGVCCGSATTETVLVVPWSIVPLVTTVTVVHTYSNNFVPCPYLRSLRCVNTPEIVETASRGGGLGGPGTPPPWIRHWYYFTTSDFEDASHSSSVMSTPLPACVSSCSKK